MSESALNYMYCTYLRSAGTLSTTCLTCLGGTGRFNCMYFTCIADSCRIDVAFISFLFRILQLCCMPFAFVSHFFHIFKNAKLKYSSTTTGSFLPFPSRLTNPNLVSSFFSRRPLPASRRSGWLAAVCICAHLRDLVWCSNRLGDLPVSAVRSGSGTGWKDRAPVASGRPSPLQRSTDTAVALLHACLLPEHLRDGSLSRALHAQGTGVRILADHVDPLHDGGDEGACPAMGGSLRQATWTGTTALDRRVGNGASRCDVVHTFHFLRMCTAPSARASKKNIWRVSKL